MVALPFTLAPSDEPTCRVRLAVLPGAWRVEQVRLVSAMDAELDVRTVAPAGSTLDAPDGRTRNVGPEMLAERDGRVQQVPYRHGLTVLFDAPPLDSSLRRAAFLRVHGWYEELDASPLPCIRWRKLFTAAGGADSFETFVVERLRKREAIRRMAGLEAGDL